MWSHLKFSLPQTLGFAPPAYYFSSQGSPVPGPQAGGPRQDLGSERPSSFFFSCSLLTRVFEQNHLQNLWSPVQNENAGPLVQKLRISRNRQNQGHKVSSASKECGIPCPAACCSSVPTDPPATDFSEWTRGSAFGLPVRETYLTPGKISSSPEALVFAAYHSVS